MLIFLYFATGFVVWFAGMMLAEHELRLAWDGYDYLTDPHTGKVIRQEKHNLRDPEDMKYWPVLLSWLLYIPLCLYRLKKERNQPKSTPN